MMNSAGSRFGHRSFLAWRTGFLVRAHSNCSLSVSVVAFTNWKGGYGEMSLSIAAAKDILRERLAAAALCILILRVDEPIIVGEVDVRQPHLGIAANAH